MSKVKYISALWVTALLFFAFQERTLPNPLRQ